jgi:hypothetical protein
MLYQLILDVNYVNYQWKDALLAIQLYFVQVLYPIYILFTHQIKRLLNVMSKCHIVQDAQVNQYVLLAKLGTF